MKKNTRSVGRLCLATAVATIASIGQAGSHQQHMATDSAAEHSPQQWADLGEAVHGGFGSYIALGIRLGLNARQRLHADRRQLDITFASGPDAPCACAVDGVMVATSSSPGQGTLRVSKGHSGAGTFGSLLVLDTKTGRSLRYTLPGSSRALLDPLNSIDDGAKMYNAVMSLPSEKLWQVSEPRQSAAGAGHSPAHRD